MDLRLSMPKNLSPESTEILSRNIKKFDKRFREAVDSGIDFNVKLEIRGNKGQIDLCRVDDQGFDRTEGCLAKPL